MPPKGKVRKRRAPSSLPRRPDFMPELSHCRLLGCEVLRIGLDFRRHTMTVFPVAGATLDPERIARGAKVLDPCLREVLLVPPTSEYRPPKIIWRAAEWNTDSLDGNGHPKKGASQ